MFWIIASAVLAVIVIILAVKIFLLRKGYDELTSDIKDQAKGDTSIPVVLTTTDKHARRAAVILNDEFRTLREEKVRYENGNKRISSAIAGISHDLRTPLTAINSYLDIMDEEQDEKVRKEYLSRIKNRTRQLSSLTQELFDYSLVCDKEEYIITNGEPEDIDLKKILEESVLSFYEILKSKGIEPGIEIPDGEVMVRCHEKHAVRIFENVISNAVKYAKDDLHIKLEKDGTATFSNTAPEMTAVRAGKLFDRYYTVEEGSSSTGLGLSIARELMAINGGEALAEYKNGELIITLRFNSLDS
ncbi:MAG: HAMP domain-containing histidine kinase [Clostridiales bacterium]|nr:HAMP domain-containing histidine kinase [Clostridiales bacterium]